MKRRGGQSAEGIRYLFGRNGTRFGRRFPAQQICQYGARCNCSDATLRPEARPGNATRLEPNSQAQHIAADWIRYLNRSGGVCEIPDVVGIAEMVENGIAEHQRQYKAEWPTLKVRRRRPNVSFCTLHGSSLFL
jgi:hypothetical protein